MRTISKSLLAITFIAHFACLSFAWAGGYELLEQSTKGIGQGLAGSTTGLGDGSEVVLNPAAMTNLKKGFTSSVNLPIIAPKADFKNRGSRYIDQLGGAPVQGDNDSGDEVGVVPNIYTVQNHSDGWAVGFGYNTPFGLVTEYDDTWVGRYSAITSELATYNFTPAIAYAPNKYLSIGANINVLYADAKLTNAVDFGTIGLSTLGLPAASQLGLLPQRADGTAKVTGDDWGVGFGVGLLVTPIDSLSLGVNYRSHMHLDLDGDARFNVPNSAKILTSTGNFIDTDAEAKVTLPESLSFGVAYDISTDWSWYGDATWTRWSRFNELRVTFDSAQADSVQDEGWDNTWRFSTGTSYQVNEELRLSTGFTFDQTPISDAEHRTPRIPDNDRYWLAFGAGYQISESLILNVSYAHLFVPDADTNLANNTGSTLVGDWDLGVDIVSVGLQAVF